jgi:hypothetical protein
MGVNERAVLTPEEYVDVVNARLVADGCDPRWESWEGPVLVGRRSDFKLQWAATNLHLFTVVAAVPQVTLLTAQRFTERAQQYAKDRKGGLPRGFQTGVAVFPALVSDRVDPAALEYAAHSQRVQFACLARPTVVDTATGTVAAYRGNPVLGLLYAGHLRRKSEMYFPAPAQVRWAG